MTLIYKQGSFSLKNKTLHILNKKSKKLLVHKKITPNKITLMTCGKCTLECWTIWRLAKYFILIRIICSVFDKNQRAFHSVLLVNGYYCLCYVTMSSKMSHQSQKPIHM